MRSIVTRPASPTAALVAIDAASGAGDGAGREQLVDPRGVIPHSVSTSRVC